MRNTNPKSVIMNIANKIPSLRYKGDESFLNWQTHSREKLSELLGLDLIPLCNDDFKVVETTDYSEYTDTYFSFQSEPGYYVPCHILKPKVIKEKLRVLICLQGHTTGMHISLGTPRFQGDEEDISSGDRDYARIAVKKGYCSIVIEQRYMGECGGTEKGPGCQHRPADGINALPALIYGRTAIGERVHDVMRAIDIISSNEYSLFDCVHKDNIAITGNSGGGTTSFYTACIDERIKMCAPSCCFCTYKASVTDISHCACNYIPSVARYFDMGDLTGLIAPRKLIICSGSRDKIFPLTGVKEAYKIAEHMFSVAEAKDNIKLVIGDGGHRYYADKILEEMNF